MSTTTILQMFLNEYEEAKELGSLATFSFTGSSAKANSTGVTFNIGFSNEFSSIMFIIHYGESIKFQYKTRVTHGLHPKTGDLIMDTPMCMYSEFTDALMFFLRSTFNLVDI